MLGPFCQVSTAPSPLPQGLLDPPAYSSLPTLRAPPVAPGIDEPPSYSSLEDSGTAARTHNLLSGKDAKDVLHFVDPSKDSILSLSLQYGVAQNILKQKNGLFANHLLAARQAILIPGEFYKGGISLSPEPIWGEEEEIRKSKVRRWMITCKVAQCVDCFI